MSDIGDAKQLKFDQFHFSVADFDDHTTGKIIYVVVCQLVDSSVTPPITLMAPFSIESAKIAAGQIQKCIEMAEAFEQDRK